MMVPGYGEILYYLSLVDGVGSANMSEDLPGKKSQLDLRQFDVGVQRVGRMISP